MNFKLAAAVILSAALFIAVVIGVIYVCQTLFGQVPGGIVAMGIVILMMFLLIARATGGET